MAIQQWPPYPNFNLIDLTWFIILFFVCLLLPLTEFTSWFLSLFTILVNNCFHFIDTLWPVFIIYFKWYNSILPLCYDIKMHALWSTVPFYDHHLTTLFSYDASDWRILRHASLSPTVSHFVMASQRNKQVGWQNFHPVKLEYNGINCLFYCFLITIHIENSWKMWKGLNQSWLFKS